MRLTPKQTHILDNIERVVVRPRVFKTKVTHPRYQLDGQECTTQVRSLLIKKWIEGLTGGRVRRVSHVVVAPLPAPVRPIINGRPFSARAVRVGW